MQKASASRFDFPSSYGEPTLTLMARDPWWIYAYWEIPPKMEREVLLLMSIQNALEPRRILRVTRQTGSLDPPFFDIEVGAFADNWYVEVGVPGQRWQAEIGLRSSDGRFYSLLRSNSVWTPRYGISDEVDPDWCLPEGVWDRLFTASGILSESISSLETAGDPDKKKN